VQRARDNTPRASRTGEAPSTDRSSVHQAVAHQSGREDAEKCLASGEDLECDRQLLADGGPRVAEWRGQDGHVDPLAVSTFANEVICDP
jgi:hypothetical protein